MKVNHNFPSLRLSFSSFPQSAGNFFSSLFKKATSSSLFLPSNTKWYKNRYFLAGFIAIPIILLVKRFFKTNVSLPPPPPPAPPTRLPRKVKRALPLQLGAAFTTTHGFYNFVKAHVKEKLPFGGEPGAITFSPLDKPGGAVRWTAIADPNYITHPIMVSENAVTFKLNVTMDNTTCTTIFILFHMELNEWWKWHMTIPQEKFKKVLPFGITDTLDRSKAMQCFVRDLIEKREHTVSEATFSLVAAPSESV